MGVMTVQSTRCSAQFFIPFVNIYFIVFRQIKFGKKVG